MSDDARIFRAANQVLRRGTKPSWENVRAELGGGSKSTIVPALARYWKQRGWRTAIEVMALPAAPAPAAVPGGDFVPRAEMEAALAREHEYFSAERSRLMLEIDGKRQAASGPELDIVRMRAERAQAERDGLAHENARLQGEVLLLTRRIQALERQVR